MESDIGETKTVLKRILKDTEEPKAAINQSDWTGIISMTILVSYVGLIVVKYVLNVEITELVGLGAAVGLIVGWYLRGKTGG